MTESLPRIHLVELPELGENIRAGKIVRIFVGAGDPITPGQTLLELETDKVVMEIPADRAGTVIEMSIKEGETVAPGAPVLRMALADSPQTRPDSIAPIRSTAPAKDVVTEERNAAVTPVGPQAPAPLRPPFSSDTDIVPAGPASRRLARELGLDLRQLRGTGARGRISIADVKAHAKRALQATPGVAGHDTTRPLPNLAAFGPVRREAMTSMDHATAANMTHAWTHIPHAWLQEKVDITELEAQRQKHKQSVKARGGALTLTALLTRALAIALRQFPRFNASLDTVNNELVYREYVHIGVAVDTEHGLLVPKIENAANKSLVDIACELTAISERARQRKLTPKDLEGAGFTISNLGGIGLSGLWPIVNWPQVAILGVAASSHEPRLVAGEFSARLLMPMTLGFDHRVINGADGARFLQRLKQLLEDPFSMLIEA